MRYTRSENVLQIADVAILPMLAEFVLANPGSCWDTRREVYDRLAAAHREKFPERVRQAATIDLATTAEEIKAGEGERWVDIFAPRVMESETMRRDRGTWAFEAPRLIETLRADAQVLGTVSGGTATVTFDPAPGWLQIRGPADSTGFANLHLEPKADPLVLHYDPEDDGPVAVFVHESGAAYASGATDEEAAHLIALHCALGGAGSIGSDGTLRLGRVIVSASGSWDHPAAGDLDARSRRVWALVGDAWASLPAWARRAR